MAILNNEMQVILSTDAEEMSVEMENKVKDLINNDVVVDKETLDKKMDKVAKTVGLANLKRCLFYGRVSTVKKEQTSSILSQHSIASEFEEQYIDKGFIIVREVFERKSAVSAVKRPKFMNIVEQCKNPEYEIDYLVVKTVDRMFRNVTDTINIMESLAKCGVGLLFYWDDLSSLDPADRNKIIDKANAAESYSNNLSTNVKRGKARNVKNGKGRVPGYCFGYDKIKCGDSSKSIINPAEAKLVKELFNRFNSGETLGSIVLDWRARGIKTKLGSEPATPALRRMLQNKIYLGLILNDRQTRASIRDEYIQLPESEWKVIVRPDLRIIDDETFEKAQRIFELNAAKHGKMLSMPKEYIFKSMIQCPICGKNFKQIKNGKTNGKDTKFYVCTTHKLGTKYGRVCDCSNSSAFRKDEMLSAIKVYFLEMLRNRSDIEELVYKATANILEKLNKETEQKDYSEEIKKVTKKYERELDLYREGLINSTSEIKKLKKELEDLKVKQYLADQGSNVKYDVKQYVDKMFISIEELVDKGVNEETLDPIKFNGLFESIIGLPNNRLVFNLKLSTELSSALNSRKKDIGSLDMYPSYSSSYSSNISPFISPVETDVKEVLMNIDPNEVGIKTSIQTYADIILKEKYCLVNIEQTFNKDRMLKEMQAVKKSIPNGNMIYRYSRRINGLGAIILDSINIIL